MLFWLALAVFVLAPAAGLVFAVRRALETWRGFKRLGSGAGARPRPDQRVERSDRAPSLLAAESGTRLDASLARLRTSRARLLVLTAAIADVRASVENVTNFIPRK